MATKCYGKFCKGRFRGFGVTADTASKGLRVLRSALIDADDGNCGHALELLGKGKVLLGSQTRSPTASKLIGAVERGCPKSRVVVIRSDVVRELATKESLLPSTWSKSEAALMVGRLRKPTGRRVLDKRASREAGRRVYVWRKPSKMEAKRYKNLMERAAVQKLYERVAHRAKTGRKRKQLWRAPIIRRRGEVVKRGRGRPRKVRK